MKESDFVTRGEGQNAVNLREPNAIIFDARRKSQRLLSD
jgi:hypothetical protein